MSISAQCFHGKVEHKRNAILFKASTAEMGISGQLSSVYKDFGDLQQFGKSNSPSQDFFNDNDLRFTCLLFSILNKQAAYFWGIYCQILNWMFFQCYWLYKSGWTELHCQCLDQFDKACLCNTKITLEWKKLDISIFNPLLLPISTIYSLLLAFLLFIK